VAKKDLPFSDENLEDFLAALLLTGSAAEACKRLGVTDHAIDKWKAEKLFIDLTAAAKEAERNIKLGVATETAFEAAGFPADRFDRMLRLRDFRAGLRQVEAQREVEATKVLRAVAGPRPTTTSKTKKTIKPGGEIETVVESTTSETASVHAANRLLDQAKKRTESTDLTDEKPDSGLVRQPHGGAIQNGKGRGRPKGKKATITLALEFLNTTMGDEGVETYLEYAMRGIVKNAYEGNSNYMAMLLALLDKGELPGGSSSSKGSEPTLLDPLFANMPDDELDRIVKRRLLAEMDVIDAEFEEEDLEAEPEEVALDA
jgi:hypothetical protein